MNVDMTHLPEFLRTRRWFGGKAWPIKQVTVVDHIEIPHTGEEALVIGVVEVTYELGNPERYVIPVRVDENGGIRDALEEDALARRLFRVLRDGSELQTGGGVLRAERLPHGQDLFKSISASPTVKRMSVEQTNTSVVFDEKIIMKLIRRVEAGLSPEIEVGRHLAEVNFAHTPRLLGYLRLEGPADSTITVAHEFVRAQADGWTHILQELEKSAEPSAAVLSSTKKLGERTAELHIALATPSSAQGFEAEPIGKEDLSRWSSSIIGELGVTLAQATAQFPELENRREALVERAKKLAHIEPSGQKIRIHGDYHLGQVLRVNDDWMIFDFEGEPSRPFAGRRERYTPLRDVAGMIRSFGYADATAAEKGSSSPKRFRALRKAFLEGYLGRAKGQAFLPSSDEVVKQMLDALELEKILYELRYELHHRPTWAKIPANTLLDPEG